MPSVRKLMIAAVVLVGFLGLLFLLFWGSPASEDPVATPIESILLNQSAMLREIASRTSVLGIAREEISWEGQKPTSLSQIYQDLWPITPPVLSQHSPLAWQMGRAGDRIVFFLEGLPADLCQKINAALNVPGSLPESPWSKQDLLRQKAALPPVKTPQALQNRGCVKTIFATYLYYDIL